MALSMYGAYDLLAPKYLIGPILPTLLEEPNPNYFPCVVILVRASFS